MGDIRALQDNIEIGLINLPTGIIVACDPFLCGVAMPFLHQVRPGKYPVYLDMLDLTGWGKRVSAAKILFDERTSPDFYIKALKGDDSNSYFVDAGIGSFMDDLTREELVNIMREFYTAHPDGNYYSDILEAEFKKNTLSTLDGFSDGLWAIYQLPASEHNIAMFASGLGDGYYESFWGIADGNRIVCLITDFGFGEFVQE